MPPVERELYLQLLGFYSWLAPDVSAAMFLYRTVAKKVLGIWFYYCAKLERHFAIVLYTNMSASSRECNQSIGVWASGIHFVRSTRHKNEPQLIGTSTSSLKCELLIVEYFSPKMILNTWKWWGNASWCSWRAFCFRKNLFFVVVCE